MDQTQRVAANLRVFQIAVASHDRENPEPHPPASGIGVNPFDMERLGFDEGEEILPGIKITADSGVTGNFRVICGAEHGDGDENIDAQITRAVGANV